MSLSGLSPLAKVSKAWPNWSKGVGSGAGAESGNSLAILRSRMAASPAHMRRRRHWAASIWPTSARSTALAGGGRSRSATGPSTCPPIELLQILQQSAPVPRADHGDSASVYGSPAGRLPGELVRIPYKLHNRERLQHLRPGIRL